MKTISLLCLISALLLWAWLALGGASPLAGTDVAARGPDAIPSHEDASGMAAIRARADAAFSSGTAAGRLTRSRTRVGPQPWPDDLPNDWPRLEAAKVVADTLREPGDRLLLVDWPERPARAVDSLRRALEARGYAVEEARTRRVPHALHARSGESEVVLTFFARDHASRVEILFLAPATG